MRGQWRANVAGLIAILVACFLALNGRTWLSEYAHFDIASNTYFLLTCPVVGVLSALILSKIYKRRNFSIFVPDHDGPAATAENIFQYPRSYGYLAIGASAVFLLTALAPESAMGAPVYLFVGVVVFSSILLALYVFIFRITLGNGELIVRGFTLRRFKLSSIVAFDLKMDRGGKYGVLTLSDNTSISFWGILQNFNDLARILDSAAKNAKT